MGMVRMKIRKKNVDMKRKHKGAGTIKLRQLRQAFAVSITSLALCCAMLAGTTYAWFTQMAASGRQTIQSGNMDVQLRYRRSLDDEWKTIMVAGGEEITELELESLFSSDKTWNPGDVEYVFLELRNTGSLPVAYGLRVEEKSGLVVKQLDTEESSEEAYSLEWLWSGCIPGRWFEAEEYQQATPPNAQMIELAESDSSPIADGFEVRGELEAPDEPGTSWEDAEAITLVIYMPTETEASLLRTADDEENVNKNSTFTIRFRATQLNAVQEGDGLWSDDMDAVFGVGPGMEAEEG